MFRSAREQANFSIEEAANRLHIAARTLWNYENNKAIPTPEVALEMSKEYKQPVITQIYCKDCCAIGKACSYEILNNVDLDVESVLMSMQQEAKEAIDAFPILLKLLRNKRKKEEFTSGEWKAVKKALHEWLDLEHNIRCLRIVFSQFEDISKLIEEHNQKCIRRHYVNKEKKFV